MNKGVASIVIAMGSLGTVAIGSEFAAIPIGTNVPKLELVDKFTGDEFVNIGSSSTAQFTFVRPDDLTRQVSRIAQYLHENTTDFDRQTKSEIARNLWDLYD